MCLQWRDPRPLANRPIEQSRSGARRKSEIAAKKATKTLSVCQ
jgi:hypothetical protein